MEVAVLPALLGTVLFWTPVNGPGPVQVRGPQCVGPGIPGHP